MRTIILLVVFCHLSISGQVGINKISPSSTLDINGSFGAAYREVSANTYTLATTDHYITYNGASTSIFTLPAVAAGTASFSGRIYKIKNISNFGITLQALGGNTLRIENIPVSSFVIPSGGYAEIINNNNISGGTWDLSFITLPKPNNVEIYGTQLTIPPHGNGTTNVADWTNHTNTAYDSGTGADAWWVISKTSTSYSHTANYSNSSRMTIVYEYQGTPFNLAGLHPILTAGNNSSFPDVFTSSFVSLANNGTSGRTRLTVSVARIDFIGNNGSNNSNWTGTFLLNLLLSRKLF